MQTKGNCSIRRCVFIRSIAPFSLRTPLCKYQILLAERSETIFCDLVRHGRFVFPKYERRNARALTFRKIQKILSFTVWGFAEFAFFSPLFGARCSKPNHVSKTKTRLQKATAAQWFPVTLNLRREQTRIIRRRVVASD